MKALVMVIAVLFMGISLVMPGISRGMSGDVNNDTKVDVFDALLVLQVAVGLHNPADYSAFKMVADVAPLDAHSTPIGDGKIDVFDALVILRRAVNLDAWSADTASILAAKSVLKGIADAVSAGNSAQVLSNLEAGVRQQITTLNISSPQAREIATALVSARVSESNPHMVVFETVLGSETIDFYMIKEEGSWKLAGF